MYFNRFLWVDFSTVHYSVKQYNRTNQWAPSGSGWSGRYNEPLKARFMWGIKLTYTSNWHHIVKASFARKIRNHPVFASVCRNCLCQLFKDFKGMCRPQECRTTVGALFLVRYRPTECMQAVLIIFYIHKYNWTTKTHLNTHTIVY